MRAWAFPRLLFVVLFLPACTQQQDAASSTRCSSAPDTEGLKAAQEKLTTLIREGQKAASGSMYELVKDLDSDNMKFLGKPDCECGNLTMYDFRDARGIGPEFSVVVAPDCQAEVSWR